MADQRDQVLFAKNIPQMITDQSLFDELKEVASRNHALAKDLLEDKQAQADKQSAHRDMIMKLLSQGR